MNKFTLKDIDYTLFCIEWQLQEIRRLLKEVDNHYENCTLCESKYLIQKEFIDIMKICSYHLVLNRMLNVNIYSKRDHELRHKGDIDGKYNRLYSMLLGRLNVKKIKVSA